MNNTQENIMKKIIENSKKINSNVFNLIRCLILALASYIKDGIQYRELKVLLNISDGKLQSNLNNLTEMGYINKVKVKLDKKELTIYMITDSGKKELEKIILWVNELNQIWEE